MPLRLLCCSQNQRANYCQEHTHLVPETSTPSISVIVPFRNAAVYLEGCLDALAHSRGCDYELILVDDGSTDSSLDIARRYGGTILTFAAARGPAFARNRGAESAAGRILFFTDADVICHPDTLARARAQLDADKDLAAVIGSYDDAPAADNFFSRYKNLTHHWVHQNSQAEASTFWTGCGAVRREIFLELGGFDESYARSSIEDIEFGYRLRSRGYRIRLCRQLTVKHAKRWTLAGIMRSDIRDRAIPWTVLQLTHGRILNDLNVSRPQRAAAFFTCLAALLGVRGLWKPWYLAGSAASLLLVIGWNRRLYRFYRERNGWWFCLRATVMHWFYYLYSTLAFAAGVAVYLSRRRGRGAPQRR